MVKKETTQFSGRKDSFIEKREEATKTMRRTEEENYRDFLRKTIIHKTMKE